MSYRILKRSPQWIVSRQKNAKVISTHGTVILGPIQYKDSKLQWRHNGRDSVSNHQPPECLLKPLFRRKSEKTPKLRVTGLCVGNSPGTGEFPTQMASNAEFVSIWWRHHESYQYWDSQWGDKKILTHSGRDKMAAIFQTTFSNAFSWMKMYQFRSKFHWSLFRRVRLTICQHWFRKWLKADQATSHYLNQCWHNSPTHICITRPQWVNISTIGFPIQFRCHLYTESGSSSLGAKEIKTERGVSILSRPCVKFLGGMVNDRLYPVITSVPYITGRQSNQDTYNRFAAGDLKFWSLTLFCTFPKHFCIIGPTKLYCKNIKKKVLFI